MYLDTAIEQATLPTRPPCPRCSVPLTAQHLRDSEECKQVCATIASLMSNSYRTSRKAGPGRGKKKARKATR